MQSVGSVCATCSGLLHVATTASGCSRCGASAHLECARSTAAMAGDYRSAGTMRCARCGDRMSEMTVGDSTRRGGIDFEAIERRVKVLFFSLVAFVGVIGSAALAYAGFALAWAESGTNVANSSGVYFVGLLIGLVGMIGMGVSVLALRLPDDELVVFRTDPASGGRDPSV